MWSMLPAILGILAAADLVALIVSAFTGGPWLFFLLLLAGMAWLAFNDLYRIGYELRFDDTYLSWRGFLRSGKVRVADVIRVDTEFLGSVCVFTCSDGQRIRVYVVQGFAPFLTALTRAHPAIGAVPWRYARLVDRAQLWRPTAHTDSADETSGAGDRKD